ncbi:MAG: phosphatidate cytidylyltransferase [Bacteroidetes bacterium]|nr:phosphatidate cytidylyltransferase [Bacteroidota bacterium]
MSNTVIRVLTSLVVGPVVLAGIYLGGWWLFPIILLISVVATWELLLMTRTRDFHPNLWFSIGLSVLYPVCFMNVIPNVSYYHILVGSLFVIPLVELFRNKPNPTINIAITIFGSSYVGIGIGSFLGIRQIIDSPVLDPALGWLGLAVIFSVWMCDTFAFFGGVNFGRTPLMPRISPKKTWEGTLSGFVAAVITMVLFGWLTPIGNLQITTFELVMIGSVIGALGTLGDLVESLIKRDFGVKDSSKIIPGHGGMFDRFDSLILVAPIVYLYLLVMVFPG